jgi:hypothetical protein
MPNLLRADTPTQFALVDVAEAHYTATRTQLGVSRTSARGDTRRPARSERQLSRTAEKESKTRR